MQHEVVIRPASVSDAAVIADLWCDMMTEQAGLDARFAAADDARLRWLNDYPVWLDDSTCRIFVADGEAGLVGFIRAHRWSPPPIYSERSEVFVDEIYVVPAARRCGFGERLFGEIRAWAEKLDADAMRLVTLSSNEASLAFWTRMGARSFSETLTVELAAGGGARADRKPRLGFR